MVILALVGVCVVFIAARLGSRWLFSTIAVNLILVSVFGSKLITVFGLITNAGNVFYACVFLATYFLLERRDKKNVLQTMWFGVGFVVFFVVMSQFVTHFSSPYPNDAVNDAIQTLFVLSPRIALASILAFIFAQYVNISIYTWLKTRMTDKFLWLRSNGANIVGQLIDSSLFFTIAFLDLSGPALLQAIFAGWFIKTLVVFLGTPLLYFDRYLTRKQ